MQAPLGRQDRAPRCAPDARDSLHCGIGLAALSLASAASPPSTATHRPAALQEIAAGEPPSPASVAAHVGAPVTGHGSALARRSPSLSSAAHSPASGQDTLAIAT